MKVVIYTVIVGKYDELREPLYIDDRFTYLCFSNDYHEEKIGIWEIRKFPIISNDNQRLSRYPKIKPYEFLKDFDYSVYMDASIGIVGNGFYESILLLIKQNQILAGVRNSWRDCLYDEGFRCILSKLDSPKKIIKEMRFIKREGFPSHYGMYEAGVIFRKHNDDKIIHQCNLWWNTVQNYAKRDQLCFSYTTWKCTIPWCYIFPDGSNARNNPNLIFHEHPHQMIQPKKFQFRKTIKFLKPILYIIYKMIISVNPIKMKKIIIKFKGLIAYDLGILEKRFFWKTNKYLSKHYNKFNVVQATKNKTLIYMLDGRAYSGGISDIIKGIISMYKFSKEIGFDFRINFCFPYNLHEYLEPNLYNWYISENEITYNSNYSIPLWIYCSHANYGKTREFENEFQRKLLLRFIKKNATKQQFHIYTNSQWSQGYEYSSLFYELFKPTKLLQDVLNYHKEILGSEYISMTFRFQQLLGDFVENESKTYKTAYILDYLQAEDLNEKISPEYGELQLRAILGDFKNKKISEPLNEIDKNKLIARCIKKITEIHTNLFPGVKILVTADSENFLSQVCKLEFVYAISGKDIHLERSLNERYNIFLKSYIDILMLSGAKKLFLLCTGSMYQSGFAKNASFINNKEYNEIFF